MKDEVTPERCNALALRQATRHVSQLYDRHLAAVGLKGTQFSIVARLSRDGPRSINDLARELVMDRTTLGRTMQPLEREGLIAVVPNPEDRRSKALRLTEAGATKLRIAAKGWTQAQAQFESAFGAPRAATLRGLLGVVSASDFDAAV
jgi:DNA-binding MarR family transcriptional regulator